VGRATAEVKLREGNFPSGSLIVKRDQPYGRLAKILLEKQVFPDASLQTYDDTAWTMGWMSHTDVKEIADKAILDVAVSPVEEMHAGGRVTGTGPIVAVAHYRSHKLITVRYRLKDLKIQAAEKEFKLRDVTFPPGSFVISGDMTTIRPAIESLGLTAVATNTTPRVPMHELDLPRLAVYSTWGSTQDVGWV